MRDISNPLLRPLFQYQPQPHDPSNIIELDSRNGAASITEGTDTLSATGTVTSGAGSITGTASITEAAQTVTGAGVVIVTGTASITEAAQTVTAAGGILVTGSATITEAAHTLTGSGTVSGAAGAITGTANITEGEDTLSADGTVPKAAGGGGGAARGSRSKRPVIVWLEEKRDEPPIPAKPKQTVRRKVEREVRKVTAEVMALEAAPTVNDIMDMLEAEARYRDFLAEQVNRMRIEALIRRMLEQAANDDEEDAAWLLLAA